MHDEYAPTFSFRLAVDGFTFDACCPCLGLKKYLAGLRRGGARKIELIG
jgi:hypothetical protein